MAILKSNLLFNRKKAAEAAALDLAPAVDVEMTADKNTPNTEVVDADISDLKTDVPRDNVQTGVQKIQAVTLTWSRTSMFSILCLYVSPSCNYYPNDPNPWAN